MNSVKIPIPAVDFNPPVYYCNRATKPFHLDGNLSKEFWDDAAFTDLFIDIEGPDKVKPRYNTRAKMLWDDTNFYIGALLEGDEIWGNITKRDAVIFYDNDFEIFIDPDSDTQQYYEFEMNVLNTVWDLFLPLAYRDGGSGLNGYDINGLQTAVKVDGTVNEPSDKNKSWSVEVVIPFAAITECLKSKKPPIIGEYYRVNFSRVQWQVDIMDGKYEKRKNPATNASLPEDNWVWAPTGVINIHYPELWAFVFFVQDEQDHNYQIPEEEYWKWELRKLYYAEQIAKELYGHYIDQIDDLMSILRLYAPNEYNATIKPYNYLIETTSHNFEISCKTEDGSKTILLYGNGKTEVYDTFELTPIK